MNIITDIPTLRDMVEYYLTQDAFCFDVETVGPRRGMPVANEVLWISFSTNGRGDVIPMGHPNGELIGTVFPLTGAGEKRVAAGLPARPSDYSRDVKKAKDVFGTPPSQLFPAEVFEVLEPLLFSDKLLTIGHNLVFDLSSVAKYYEGRVPVGPYFDTMVGSFLYDNRNKNKCGLADCLKRELGYEMVKGVGKEVEAYAYETVAKYSYLDAKYTFLLWRVVQAKLTSASLDNVMQLEMGVLRVLCDMKLTGAPIDLDVLVQLAADLEVELEAAKAEVYKIAGQQFNINSNREKQEILFGSKESGGRGLRAVTLTTGGEKKKNAGEPLLPSDYSVSADTLKDFQGSDLLVDALANYSDLNKLLSTYVIPYLGGDVTRTTSGKAKIVHKDSLLVNSRIHCDFMQHGVETGRFSSKNPNLQNIPAPNNDLPPEEDNGRKIRNLFYAPDGYKLVVADYSQIEPRIIASMSEDPIMLKNYLDGGDIYTTIGDTMGVNRKAGKVLVLSIVYGVGPKNIAAQIGCSVKEARDLLDNFGRLFPSVGSYKAKVVRSTKSQDIPHVKTILGRIRYLPDINSYNEDFKASAERQAFNTRIQGSAADIMKLALVRAYSLLPPEAKLTLTIHDELVTLTPDDVVEETVDAIKEAMEDIHLLKVPLIADIKVVQRWGDAK